jgi:hypothetical protein
MWIYPKLIGSDTSCHLLTLFVVWKRARTATVRNLGPSWLLAEQLGESTGQNLQAPKSSRALEGRLTVPLAKVTLLDRTRGAFHP